MELTRTEFSLLELFLRNPRQVLTRSADLRARLGLRLRADVELARGVRRLPAAEDRGGRGAAADPYGARRRLRPARAMTLRARLTLSAALAVAAAVVLASIARLLRRAQRDARRDRRRRCAHERRSSSERPFDEGFPPVPEPLLGGARAATSSSSPRTAARSAAARRDARAAGGRAHARRRRRQPRTRSSPTPRFPGTHVRMLVVPFGQRARAADRTPADGGGRRARPVALDPARRRARRQRLGGAARPRRRAVRARSDPSG